MHSVRDLLRIEIDRHRNDTDNAPINRRIRRGLKGKSRTAYRVDQIEQMDLETADLTKEGQTESD